MNEAVKEFFEPGSSNIYEASLRRTLVLQEHESSIGNREDNMRLV